MDAASQSPFESHESQWATLCMDSASPHAHAQGLPAARIRFLFALSWSFGGLLVVFHCLKGRRGKQGKEGKQLGNTLHLACASACDCPRLSFHVFRYPATWKPGFSGHPKGTVAASRTRSDGRPCAGTCCPQSRRGHILHLRNSQVWSFHKACEAGLFSVEYQQKGKLQMGALAGKR